ncbi:Mu transposase C-terminal domain-containing protein [Alteromonas sp. a30]|uniref:Mu transposase C-terminal domain-containing protein n=1 Tax=Alteromonas sp. a30 TaxID=2730917 RepID=UPI00227F2435|nr:Mu transposase C-terminal domain-containing protein [Alteromonas sp. a30]
MLQLNQVFQLHDQQMRIVWRDSKIVFWIDINAKAPWPVAIKSEEIESLIIEQELVPIDDPYLSLILREIDKTSTNWIKCEKAWNIIKDHINDVALFYRNERGKLINSLVEQHQVTKQSITRYIRRYWQRGMNQYALLPDYVNSGGKGKTRDTSKGKLGRNRVITDGIGHNVTPDIARVFRQAIEVWVLNKKNTSVADAYAIAVAALEKTELGTDKTRLPTERQFRYFYKREYTTEEIITSQLSDIDYENNYAALKSTSTTETLGPGYRYQIDATVADIYLLSEYDRTKIVGRPVLYFVTDVFSRMVVGMYVGFEGPSWVSAMMAVANAASNKVNYCKEFGIEISHEDWPVEGLPDTLLADQGEFKGTKVETFIKAHRGHIENAKARKGSAKGIVENKFLTIQRDFKPYSEGIVEPVISKKRGGNDYRLDATLTLYEFTQKIIYIVLYHNNKKQMEKYDPCEGMPTSVKRIPLELWNWGTSALTGKNRPVNEELLRINLLPHTTATVSDLGIRVFGAYYTCQEIVQQGWLIRTVKNRPAKIQVAYDPRLADHVYIRPSGNLDEYWVCNLSDHSRRFKGMTFWDLWRIVREENKAMANQKVDSALAKGSLIEKLAEIEAEAKNKKPDFSSASKTQRVKDIRENKQLEKAAERAKTAIRPSTPQQEKPAKVVSINKETPQDYNFPDMTDILFKEDDDE